MSKYYAVKKGRTMGVYDTWDECKANVNRYKGAIFKSFPTQKEANDFVWGINSNTTNNNKITNVIKKDSIARMRISPKRKIKSKYVISIDNELFNNQNSRCVFVDGSFQKRGNSGIGGYGVYFGKNNPYNILIMKNQIKN